MKKHWMQILVLLVLVVWVTGCATMSDVIQSKEEGKGTSKVYSVNADQAWEIARTVFRWEGTDAIEEHRTEGYMLTSTGPDNLTTAGAVMGAWIEPVDKNSTRVTVVTKRRVATNIFTSLTETTFHEHFAQTVGTINRGDRLPSKPPK